MEPMVPWLVAGLRLLAVAAVQSGQIQRVRLARARMPLPAVLEQQVRQPPQRAEQRLGLPQEARAWTWAAV